MPQPDEMPLEEGAIRGSVGWYNHEDEVWAAFPNHTAGPMRDTLSGPDWDGLLQDYNPHYGFMVANGAITLCLLLLVLYRAIVRFLKPPGALRPSSGKVAGAGMTFQIPARSLYKYPGDARGGQQLGTSERGNARPKPAKSVAAVEKGGAKKGGESRKASR